MPEITEADWLEGRDNWREIGRDTYTREDARDDHAITQWETAHDLGEA